LTELHSVDIINSHQHLQHTELISSIQNRLIFYCIYFRKLAADPSWT